MYWGSITLSKFITRHYVYLCKGDWYVARKKCQPREFRRRRHRLGDCWCYLKLSARLPFLEEYTGSQTTSSQSPFSFWRRFQCSGFRDLPTFGHWQTYESLRAVVVILPSALCGQCLSGGGNIRQAPVEEAWWGDEYDVLGITSINCAFQDEKLVVL